MRVFRVNWNHRRHNLIANAKKLGSVKIKNLKGYVKITKGKTSHTILESESHVATPKLLNAAESVELQDLSFIPSLFKDKRFFLAMNSKYETIQEFLQREELPIEVMEILEAAVENQFNEKESIEIVAENLVMNIGSPQFNSKQRQLEIKLEELVDMKQLEKVTLDEWGRKNMFAETYNDLQGAQRVVHFLRSLSDMQQEHAIYILAKSFAIKKGYAHEVKAMEVEVDKQGSSKEFNDDKLRLQMAEMARMMKQGENPYNIFKVERQEHEEKKQIQSDNQ